MKKLLVLIFLFHFSTSFSQIYRISAKDTCHVGIFITSLHDFNLSDESYTADFWLWFNYKNDSLDLLKTSEITSSISVKASIPDTEKKGNINWATEKIRARLMHNWQLENFPFDRQTLKLEIEEAIYDTTAMIYLPDIENSKYDANNISLDGWKIINFNIQPNVKTYETTYGDPELTGKSSYPSVLASITIQRVGLGLFYKLFTGVYVAFLITIMVFFIDPSDVDPRFGLSVGGLFASVGNKYIVDSILPETTSFTLIDKVHSLTFLYILVSIVTSVISLHFSRRGKPTMSKRIDLSVFAFLAISYVLINAYLIMTSINS